MRKYNKLIIWALAVIGVSLSSCDDIFEKLAVNPNQQDVSSFYTSNPQLSSSASFLRLNVLSSLN